MNRVGYLIAIVLAAIWSYSHTAREAVYTYAVAKVSETTTVQDENSIKRMQKQLLGPYNEIRALTSSNIYHAYLTFMQNVQAKHSNWTQTDWANAKVVSERLNKKYNALFSIVSISDKAQIKVLQGEFLQLYKKSITS
ncbi:hypothetical protein [Pontibacter sp. H249]|uniref:hypothetical protein n=1 Tax=Pontibacter sp. H249 TaxID=3133420 RepID=UPI0030C0E817